MKIGVFISPSAQWWNACKFGDTEEQHERKIAFAAKALFDKDDRFNCVVCEEFFNMTEDQRLTRAVELSDQFWLANNKNSWHLALHSDAYNTKVNGFSVFYTGSGSGKMLAQILAVEFAKISPWGLRQLRDYSALKEMKTKASSILLENNFHDTVEGANWIHSNINNIALCLYQSTCMAENFSPLTFDEEKKPTTSTNTIDSEQWKKDLVQKCLDLNLLKDPAWIKKVDDGMPVFAVCSMLVNLYNQLKK